MKCEYHNQFAFILQTGLRVGELTGLKWSDIDFEKKVIHVQRSMGYISSKGWITGETKTKSGNRKIPLTKEALKILSEQKSKRNVLQVTPIMYADLVFTNTRGNPISTNNYDYAIRNICRRKDMRSFSMHTLRHTFATRCIEAGMKPKTLQGILGHSNINMTMNLYVHITEDEKIKEIENIEDMLKVI